MGKWIFSQPNDWAGKSGTLPSDGCYHPVSSCDDTNSCQKPVRSRQKPFYHPFFCLSAVNDSHLWCHCCHCHLCHWRRCSQVFRSYFATVKTPSVCWLVSQFCGSVKDIEMEVFQQRPARVQAWNWNCGVLSFLLCSITKQQNSSEQQKRNTKGFGCIEYIFWSLPHGFWTFTIVNTWQCCSQTLWFNFWNIFDLLFSFLLLNSLCCSLCWSFAFGQHTSCLPIFHQCLAFWPNVLEIITGTPTKRVWCYTLFTRLTIKSTKLAVRHTWDNLVIVNHLQTWEKYERTTLKHKTFCLLVSLFI